MNIRHQILSTSRRLWQLCFVAMAALALWSCGEDDFPSGGGVDGSGDNIVKAGFNIVVSDTEINPSASRSSRAPEGDYDPGKGYENYIDIENRDFMFMFFNKENVYISSLAVESVLPMSEGPTSKTYYVTGEIDKSIAGEYVKILAVANWGKDIYDALPLTPGVTKIDDVCNAAVYTYDPSESFPTADNLIPLYGITNEIKLTVDALNLAKAGTIHLLRAFAKVDVELSEYDEGKNTLESVSLVNYNSRGYCAPAGIYSQDDYVHNEYFSDYANTPHIPADSVVKKSVPFKQISDRLFRIYIPEFKNVGVEESDRCYIVARLKGFNNGTDVRVDFKYYDRTAMPSGSQLFDPFDILRNYWYKFTLSTSPIKVSVKVVPYSEVALKPDFGLFDGPNWVPVYDDDMNTLYWYDRETGQYYNTYRQPIDNPFMSTDPVSGWAIIRDTNGDFMYYYDSVNGKFYDVNRKEIANPNQPLPRNELGYIIIKDGNNEVLYYLNDKVNPAQYYDKYLNPIANPYEPVKPEYDAKGRLVIRDSDGKVLYYYDRSTDTYYDSADRVIDNPFIGSNSERDEHGWLIVRDENNNILYLYDDKNNRYYDKNGNQIQNPNKPVDKEYSPEGWLVVRDPASSSFQYYYDEVNKKYYNWEKWEIIYDSKKKFLYYYDATNKKYYNEDHWTIVFKTGTKTIDHYEWVDRNNVTRYYNTKKIEYSTATKTKNYYIIRVTMEEATNASKADVIKFFYDPTTKYYYNSSGTYLPKAIDPSDKNKGDVPVRYRVENYYAGKI